MSVFGVLVIILLLTFQCYGTSGDETLSLDEVESLALKNSDMLAENINEQQAAAYKINQSKSLLYPKLSLDANFRYVSVVPALTFPTGQQLAFGDNENYSFGPVLSYNLIDFGQSRATVESAKQTYQSKQIEQSWLRRQSVLTARTVYLKCLLKFEQIDLTLQSLKLAENQHKDILNRTRAGAATRIDLLAASKEVNTFKLQLKQLKADYENELQNLAVLINPAEHSPQKTNLKLQTMTELKNKFATFKVPKENDFTAEQHPLVKALEKNIESVNLLAESSKAAGLPKVSVFAKTSLDYPNGPILQQINQNTFGVNITIPIYEGKKSLSEHYEKSFTAKALSNRKNQSIKELSSEFKKALIQFKALQAKSDIYHVSIKESEERARLVYSSYLSGKISFLEVQSANLQALDAKVQNTFNEIQKYTLLAQLASFLEDN